MPSKKAQDEEEDHAVSSLSRRKSTRMTSKNDGTPSRAESNATSASSAPTPRLNAKKSASVESDASSAITPSRRSKKGDSVEPSTPRRTSARLSSMSENPENAVELLELPAPRRRNSSTSSMGSVTTPRRSTRTAVKALPVLEEVEVIEDEGVKTPPKEAQELAPEVPASAQKRYANLASNLVKMVNSPVKMKTVLEVEEDEEITVLPVEKNAVKKESLKKESPKKAESPAKAASPKKETSKTTVTPKKRDSPQKKSDEVEEEEEDEPMDWEAGPQKTPIMHHPKPQTKSTGVRMEQLVKDAQDTPRAVRAARRERPSSAVIFGVQEEKKDVEVVVLEDDDDVLPHVIATPAKKTASPVKTPQKTTVSPKISPAKADKGEKNVATPKKAPVKVVEEEEEEDEEDEVEVIDDEEEVSDEDDDLKELIEMEEDEEEEDEEEEEEEEKEVQVAKSPKKTEKKQKVTEEEEEEQLDEDMEEDDEDEEEDEEEEEEEDYVGEDGTFPAVSFGKVFDGSVDFHAALESVYAWAFARGSSRVDDLPGRLVAAVDAETVWQQIEHRNAQITKDCKKAKKAGLLEKTITLTEVGKGEKKGKGKKRRAEEEEDDEEDVEFDDEDLLMDQDEEEDGEEMDDEEDEGEGNLFDMTEEELSRLDEDLKAIEADGDEEEEEEEERPRKKKEQQEKKKKFPKSAVDDRFFSLAEMEAAADAMEKDGAIEEGILDDGEEEGDAAYTYDEFFGADDDDVFGGKKKGRKPMDDDSVAVSKKAAKTESRKSVSWADGSGKELRQERLIEPTGKMRRLTAAALSGEEEEEEEGQKEETEETEERILLGPADEEEKEQKTPLKGSIKSIKSRIAQLEEENLESRKWDLQGEVGGAQRGENTLLEQHVEFDHGMTRAPTITEDFNEKIEAIVLQRFKDKAWDDPVRTVRQEERTDEYRNKLVDEDLLIKQSLSSVYEKEYEKAQEGADASSAAPAVNPKHAEIDEAWTELFGLIDPLFHFNVTPQQAKAEVKVITNVRALQQEEVGAMMSTEEMLIAPEEVKKREKGTLKGKEERDTTDKKRERRKKKQKQRAVLETRGEEGLKRMLEKKDETDDNGEPKKKKKKKNPDGVIAPSTSSGGKFKSTDFFTKLQATVQNELVEKTKKAKVKSATKGNSAKFKL